jgi:mitogen-activated protein kinase kinase
MEWACGLMDRDNRKSHLAPQLSPATQDLLHSSDSPIYLDQTDGTLQTPTSGEIPILGAIVSPRDQYSSISNRSPTRSGPGSSSFVRTSGPSVHPGLGPRVATTNYISRSGPSISAGDDSLPPGPQSASKATFSLPLRPGPSGPLPPPPPRKESTTEDMIKKENRRQGTFGPPLNGAYGF